MAVTHSVDEAAAPSPSRRPAAVLILAAFWVLYAVIGILWLAGWEAPNRTAAVAVIRNLGLPDVAMVGVVALALLVAAGLVAMQRWAWVLTLVLTFLALVGELAWFVRGDAHYLGMAVHAAMAFYLNQPELRRRFRRRGTESPLSAQGPDAVAVGHG